MASGDTENMAIFHFNNIYLSLVIFTLRSVCHKYTASIHTLLLLLLFVFSFYTVAAHPWHLHMDRGACGQCHCICLITYVFIRLSHHMITVKTNILPFYPFSISGCSKYLAQVCYFTIFNQALAASDSLFVLHVLFKHWVYPSLSQGRVHVACSCTPTCLKKITSPERGYCCSRKTTCGTWGSSPKVTSCTWRQGAVKH